MQAQSPALPALLALQSPLPTTTPLTMPVPKSAPALPALTTSAGMPGPAHLRLPFTTSVVPSTAPSRSMFSSRRHLAAGGGPQGAHVER